MMGARAAKKVKLATEAISLRVEVMGARGQGGAVWRFRLEAPPGTLKSLRGGVYLEVESPSDLLARLAGMLLYAQPPIKVVSRRKAGKG